MVESPRRCVICQARFASWFSIIGRLNEAAVFLTNLLRLLERTRSLTIQTPKIRLNVLNVEFEVSLDQVSELLHRSMVAWYKWLNRCNAGFSPYPDHRGDPKYYSPRSGRTAQPEDSRIPYFLD